LPPRWRRRRRRRKLSFNTLSAIFSLSLFFDVLKSMHKEGRERERERGNNKNVVFCVFMSDGGK